MGLMSWLRGGRPVGGGNAAPEAGPVDRIDRSDRVDVQRIAPMQRTVPEPDLVINPVGFQGGLSTRQPTALSTPLGHLVSPDAPTGVLHGITSPAPGSPVPAVQRSVDMPARRVVGGGKAAPVAVPVSVSLPVAVPVQRASSVMTSAGTSAVADLPVRQLVGEQPLLPASDPGPGPEPEPVSGPAQEPPSRRAPGLGAPLAGLPPTAQRQAAASVPGSGTPEASSGPLARPPVAPTAPIVPVVPEATDDEVESAQPVVAPLLGDDPSVSTVPGTEPPAAATPSAPAPALQRSVVSSAPPHVASPTVPLLGDRPLTLRTAVQRDARGGTEPPQPQTAPQAAPVTAPTPVPVRWTTPGRGASAPPPPAASAPVQLSVISSTPRPPAPVSAGVPAALPVQRKAGGGPPVPGSPPRTDTGGAPLPTAGAFAVAAGVAQRMPDGSVVFGSSSAPPSSHSPGTSRPVVQRDAELSEEPPPTDSEPETGSEPEPDPVDESGAPAATSAGAGPAAAAPARPGGTPVVTDELVRALYAPLSRLLKADLRLERERAGYLINTRH